MPPRFPQTIALRPRRALSALVLAAVILGAAGPATADALGIDIDGSVSSTTNRAPSFGATPTITVTDENEPPLAPGAPAVGRVVGSLTSLAVRWTAPNNTGRPAIESYDVQYRTPREPWWSMPPRNVTDTAATITHLLRNTLYEVQVRAKIANGDGPWSESGWGTTGKNTAPSFGATSTTRSVAENTEPGQAIGGPEAATDPDSGDTLTYSLEDRDDAAAFDIDEANGQLRTSAALDYETRSSYSVTVVAEDSEGASASIEVTIAVTNANDPPSFDPADNTRSVAENTEPGQAIGDPVTATDPEGNTLTYRLGGTDAAAFDIDEANGQLRTSAALDYETRSSYSVTVVAEDSEGASASIEVTIAVTNANDPPSFDPADNMRSVAENTEPGQAIGDPVTATDPEGNTLTYRLGGTDADAFDIDEANGQLRTSAALDYETRSSYSVTVVAEDSEGASDSIEVTIAVTNANEPPSFDPADNMRSVAENTEPGQAIGDPVAATDPEGNTLTYSLGGTDADAFDIDSDSGQLRTSAALDYETRSSYSVTVVAEDSEGASASIEVTIAVTNANEPPSFDPTDNTRSVAENTEPGQAIGDPVTATDPEGNTLTYSLEDRDDAAAFDIDEANGQLRTSAALDYETRSSYSVTVVAEDSEGASDSIEVTIAVTNANEPPSFDPADNMRSVAENTEPGQAIGDPVAATDPEGNTLTYRLGGTDADAFGIDEANGQLRTSAALDYETRSSYSVTVVAEDSEGASASIEVAIAVTNANEPPSFDPADNMRSVAENTEPGQAIGDPVTATDPEGNTLTYRLEDRDDAAAFDIDEANGQLRTSAALDYETRSSYSVTVVAEDSEGASASIEVTIAVTNANDPPSFDPTDNTRSVAENTEPGQAIGDPVTATDPEGNTLTYRLGGTDADAFDIDEANGQLRTSAALDYETRSSYSVTVVAEDSEGASDSIEVAIAVTNANEPPSFDPTDDMRTVAENTEPGQTIGDPVAAMDPDSGNTLTYRLEDRDDAAAFDIDEANGQLRTSAALDYETRSSYSVTVVAEDSEGASDSIEVTIAVTNANEPPSFDSTSTTRSVAENADPGHDIGDPVAAMDPDSGDTLTYLLGGPDAAAFDIDEANGQIRTRDALDHEAKASYSVRMVALDTQGASASIEVTIEVTDANDPPSFDPDDNTRSVAENTGPGQTIGDPVAAMDSDSGDTLTYRLEGTDAAEFDIESASGQLRTSAALDHEAKASYSVTVVAQDNEGASASIEVTIAVTNANDPPSFDPDDNTRSVAENTGPGQAIGDPVAATDPDSDETLTYRLEGTDAAAFGIDSTSGQLRTRAALDHEAQSSYSVMVAVEDTQGASATIEVTIAVTDENEPPAFDSTSTTRSVAENAAAGHDIGAPVAAMDPDSGETLTYLLGGPDAAVFDIVPTSGQLRTRAALDHEAQSSYSVTVVAEDSEGASATIEVTIAVTDENEPPAFDSTSTTRSVAENAAAGHDIGAPVAAMDPDSGETLTYRLEGTDAAAFDVVPTSGQLRTRAALDHEAKASYSVMVMAEDSEGASATIEVTIAVTDENEPPDAPAAPTFLSATDESLTVSWTAPSTAGRPDITSYDLQYRAGTSSSFTDGPQDITGTTDDLGSEPERRLPCPGAGHERRRGRPLVGVGDDDHHERRDVAAGVAGALRAHRGRAGGERGERAVGRRRKRSRHGRRNGTPVVFRDPSGAGTTGADAARLRSAGSRDGVRDAGDDGTRAGAGELVPSGIERRTRGESCPDGVGALRVRKLPERG